MVSGHPESPCFHMRREKRFSHEEDMRFLNAVVDQVFYGFNCPKFSLFLINLPPRPGSCKERWIRNVHVKPFI